MDGRLGYMNGTDFDAFFFFLLKTKQKQGWLVDRLDCG